MNILTAPGAVPQSGGSPWRPASAYATLMVNLDLGRSNAAVLRVAGDLAVRFGASVIGVAACRPVPNVYNDGYISADLIDQDRRQIEREIRDAEAEFYQALRSRVDVLDWRSTITYESPARAIAKEARGADILLTGAAKGSVRGVNAGDLVMELGRAVLTVPENADRLNRVLVAWKDTREARRAIFDALPLLQAATRVLVVEIATDDDAADAGRRTDDVARWLTRHGVAAEAMVVPAHGDDTQQLDRLAEHHAIDVVVAGAFGHSRLREWVLGGFTRHLLLGTDRCCLVAH